MDDKAIERAAKALHEWQTWGGPISPGAPEPWATTARAVREKIWDELPDAIKDGPCNVDCQCEHHFEGKNDYRAIARVVFAVVQ